jgi:hypothetical protein
MKILGVILVLGCFWVPSAKADVEVVRKESMHFMDGYDARIAALENYTVTYREPREQAKRHPRSAKGADGLAVKLVPAKKKS